MEKGEKIKWMVAGEVTISIFSPLTNQKTSRRIFRLETKKKKKKTSKLNKSKSNKIATPLAILSTLLTHQNPKMKKGTPYQLKKPAPNKRKKKEIRYR